MSAIVVAEFQIRECQFFGTTAKLRLYCDDDWTDSLGVRHLSGSVRSVNSFYQEIACTLANDVLTVPAFTTYSTVDAIQNPNVRISAEIFDQAGAWRKTLFDNWFIPNAPTTNTRNAIEIANQGQHLVWPPNWYLNAVGVQQLIDAVIGVLRFATSVIAGWVRLSKIADDVTDPVAVGANDYGAVGHAGIVEMSAAPTNPLRPIALSVTDPTTALLPTILATGTGTLVVGAATIAAPLVDADSPIHFVKASDGIAGELRAIRDPGTGFLALSSEGGDAGDFRWFLLG